MSSGSEAMAGEKPSHDYVVEQIGAGGMELSTVPMMSNWSEMSPSKSFLLAG
jgi:hypothetical protein